MKTNVRLFIFFLYTIKITIPELLSHTIIKFEPFEAKNVLPLQHFNTSNTTIIDTKFLIHDVKTLQKRHIQRVFYTSNNLLDQRIHGNVVPQCPCVIKPGTDKCIAYDSRYQAASIEEALVAFPDVTMDDDSLKYPTSGIINAELFACRTLECQTCAAILLKRIKQIGMVPLDLQVSIPLPRTIDPRNCRRLRFLRSYPVSHPPQASYYMRTLIERGLRYIGVFGQQRVIHPTSRNHFWQPTRPPPQPIIFPPPHIQPHQFQFPFFQPQHHPPQYPIQQPWIPRFGFPESSIQRQIGTSEQMHQHSGTETSEQMHQHSGTGTSEQMHQHSGTETSGQMHEHSEAETMEQMHEHSETETWGQIHDSGKKKVKRKAEPPVLGIRYMISCVQRGEGDDDNMLALCSACWTWRKLPPDYFPPLINELVCSKENGDHCLSGWGKCQQKYRNFDVLRNVNGNWQPTTISTATCCDCRIRAGTEIHPLVIGKRQN
ncbi:unnamed protein product [Cercopithifilaria johnstoni]|uniref:Uncharacterized protein n=1 Tax=Cercopithifilaria johnstoni TaxID=2874296 RepID=A0A8J2M4K0_9BILA|nr:unnamed protein product [Cercopithifilaria johnstoni]